MLLGRRPLRHAKRPPTSRWQRMSTTQAFKVAKRQWRALKRADERVQQKPLRGLRVYRKTNMRERLAMGRQFFVWRAGEGASSRNAYKEPTYKAQPIDSAPARAHFGVEARARSMEDGT